MTWSFQIGKLFGIPLRVHVTFLLLLLLVFTSGFGGYWGGLYVLALFACVVLHELAHSLMARRYGVPVRHIILLPIGGISMLERMPDEPREEFNVAFIGPLTSLALAVLLGALAYALGDQKTLLEGSQILVRRPQALDGHHFLAYLAWVNLVLALFNLLPIFPADGGRVLRSLLAQRMDYTRATHAAAVIGQALAVLMGLWGLLGGGIWFLLIAIFLYLGASAEDTHVRLRHTLREVPAASAMISEFRSLDKDELLRDAFRFASHSYQHDFPVTDNGQLVGLVTRQALISGLHERGENVRVAEIMVGNPCRVGPQDSLADIYQQISNGACPIAAVVEGDRLLGLVTPESVSQYILAEAYQSRQTKHTPRQLPPESTQPSPV